MLRGRRLGCTQLKGVVAKPAGDAFAEVFLADSQGVLTVGALEVKVGSHGGVSAVFR